VIAGAALTTVNSAPLPSSADIQAWQFVPALFFGIINFLAMGVDFPESNRRFSRLAWKRNSKQGWLTVVAGVSYTDSSSWDGSLAFPAFLHRIPGRFQRRL
jgi:hypothetical protein